MEDEVIIIPNRLHWISSPQPPRNKPKSYFFTIDEDLVYESFNKDFGPLNLGMTYKYCHELDKLIKNSLYTNHTIYHYTQSDKAKRSNSAYLMGAYIVLVMKRSAKEAISLFGDIGKLQPFRDASSGPSTHELTIEDCLRALEMAVELQWMDYRLFNLKEYEFYEKVENGDMNWVIPNKMLAFGTPTSSHYSKGYRTFTPEDFVPIFKKLGVTTVVRLNKPTYWAERFVSNGIKHYDVFFPDGSVPDEKVVNKFFDICSKTTGAIAIHCKAGLGRTGTLIALYAMKNYGWSARDFIGWNRICRPGSVLGPQQNYLIEMEPSFKKYGSRHSYAHVRKRSQELFNTYDTYEDKGQGDRLLNAKRQHQNSSAMMKRSPSAVERRPNQEITVDNKERKQNQERSMCNQKVVVDQSPRRQTRPFSAKYTTKEEASSIYTTKVENIESGKLDVDYAPQVRESRPSTAKYSTVRTFDAKALGMYNRAKLAPTNSRILEILYGNNN